MLFYDATLACMVKCASPCATPLFSLYLWRFLLVCRPWSMFSHLYVKRSRRRRKALLSTLSTPTEKPSFLPFSSPEPLPESIVSREGRARWKVADPRAESGLLSHVCAYNLRMYVRTSNVGGHGGKLRIPEPKVASSHVCAYNLRM